MAGEPRVLGHDDGGLARSHDEEIERQRRGRSGRLEPALRAGEVERAEGLVDEHRPAARADQPGDGDASAVRAKLVAALPAAHAVVGSAPVELRAAFAETEQRRLACRERNGARLRIDPQPLDGFAADGEPERVGREVDAQRAVLNGPRAGVADFGERRTPRGSDQRAVRGHGRNAAIL